MEGKDYRPPSLLLHSKSDPFLLFFYFYNQRFPNNVETLYANINKFKSSLPFLIPNTIVAESSNIEWIWKTLKKSIQDITLEVKRIYQSLKEFTENAFSWNSTPLAIF